MSSAVAAAADILRVRWFHGLGIRAALCLLAFCCLVSLVLMACALPVPTPHPTTPPTPTPDPEPSASDIAGLVAFYNATSGEEWLNNTRWLSDAPVSQWFGVTTNANGRVIGLVLTANGLSGELPPELGNLTHLKRIDLPRNDLKGRIPRELGSLASLEHLSLTINGLSGEIPPELGNLANLTEMWIDGNQLSGEIPRELGALTKLVALRLGANRFTGCIPDGLSNVPSNDLPQLDLPFCGF